MKLFDIRQYELPSEDCIDWKITKYHLGLFLSAYKITRERCKLPVLPKISTQYYLTNEEVERVNNNENQIIFEKDKNEFIKLNKVFILGYSSIMHPYKVEITERRRKIFLLRFLYGLSIDAISERIHYQKNIIISESKKSLIQFCSSTSLLEKIEK